VSAPSASASVIITVTTTPVTLSISPTTETLKAGFSQLYTATVGGTTNTGVTWSVNGHSGDTSYPGSVLNGTYTAPAPVVTTDTYFVTATSNADPTKSVSASVTVTPLENQEQQTFPIKLGASGVNANSQDCCSGTLGSLLQDQNGKQYILSNNHVLGGSDMQAQGRRLFSQAMSMRSAILLASRLPCKHRSAVWSLDHLIPTARRTIARSSRGRIVYIVTRYLTD